jgi:hypothetical protein
MSGFDDGPLTGAPLNKPKTAMKGDCCPPVILQTDAYQIVGGQAQTSLKIYGIFTGLASAVTMGIRKTTQTGTLPNLLLSAITPGGDGELDTFTMSFDSTLADSPFAVQANGPCGCVDVAEVEVIFP